MRTHLAAAAPVALSTQGPVTYLQGLFGLLFLGIDGIVAIFFLFTREITRFVQFLVLAMAVAVVFYMPTIVQKLVTGTANALGAHRSRSDRLPPTVLIWLTAQLVIESKRLPELVTSQPWYSANGDSTSATACVGRAGLRRGNGMCRKSVR